MFLGNARHPAQQHAIGTQKAAVWPTDEYANEEQAAPKDNHIELGVHAEKSQEWIVFANDEIRFCDLFEARQRNGKRVI